MLDQEEHPSRSRHLLLFLQRSVVWVLGSLAVMIVALVLYNSIYLIGDHEVGILLKDDVATETLEPGWHFQMPPRHGVVEIKTTPQKLSATGISMATKDNFAMNDTEFVYTVAVPADKAFNLYKQAPNYKSLLKTAIQRYGTNVAGQYELLDVPPNRAAIELVIRLFINRYEFGRLL